MLRNQIVYAIWYEIGDRMEFLRMAKRVQKPNRFSPQCQHKASRAQRLLWFFSLRKRCFHVLQLHLSLPISSCLLIIHHKYLIQMDIKGVDGIYLGLFLYLQYMGHTYMLWRASFLVNVSCTIGGLTSKHVHTFPDYHPFHFIGWIWSDPLLMQIEIEQYKLLIPGSL